MSATCGACTGQCCYNALVRLSGDDVHRIAHGQRLDTESFVDVVPDTGRAADGSALSFAIGSPPVPHLIVLRHSARVRGACTFLLLLAKHQPCGIYADRPMVCRLYPIHARDGHIAVRDDVICRPAYWDAEALQADAAAWTALAGRRDDEWRRYERVVRAWNGACATGQPATPARYLAYLRATYDAINEGRTDGSVMTDPAIDAIAERALTAFVGTRG